LLVEGCSRLLSVEDVPGMVVSSDPGAVQLAAAGVVDAWRASSSARSTDRTSATPGDGEIRRALRGDTEESADDQVDCKRASVHGDIGLNNISISNYSVFQKVLTQNSWR